jgi:predicted RNA polymerase sigma factor
VLHVLYLIFNEGYTSSSGPSLHRTDLSDEAIRLTRAVHALVPDDGEVAGLLALMLLTDARRAARTGPSGELIPLDEQDRGLWNRQLIQEGTALVSRALAGGSIGLYQLPAAIAALHQGRAAGGPGQIGRRAVYYLTHIAHDSHRTLLCSSASRRSR